MPREMHETTIFRHGVLQKEEKLPGGEVSRQQKKQGLISSIHLAYSCRRLRAYFPPHPHTIRNIC